MSKEQMFKLLNEVRNKLPHNDVECISEYIEHHEWGLGYETLCIQLYEYDIQISTEFYEKVAVYGQSIGIDSSIWLPLQELTKIE